MKVQKMWQISLYSIPCYFLQGGLFERGSIISKTFLFIWLLLIVNSIFKLSKKVMSSGIMKSMLLFVLVLGISWLFSPKAIPYDDLVMSTFGEYKNTIMMLLTFFPFYYCITKNIINNNYIVSYVIVNFIIYTYAYYVMQAEALETFFWKDSATNNGGYLLPLFFPLTGFLFKDSKSFIYWGICLLLTILSFKRGAILCIAVQSVLFIYFYAQKSQVRFWKNKYVWGVFFVGIILLFVVYKIYLDSLYLQDRLLDTVSGNSSGRDSIYDEVIRLFCQSAFLTQIFGHGFMQTLAHIGIYAHSDWLELLFDLGILGVLLYFVMHLKLLVWYLKNQKIMNSAQKFTFLSALFCWWIKSIFSMGFNSPEAALLSIAFAIIIAEVELKNNKICSH